MKQKEIKANETQTRSAGRNRPGGLLSSGIVARANPVLPEDIVQETVILDPRIHITNEYVRFFNDADDMLKTIVSVVNNSPTCAAIIQQKTALIVGDGFTAMLGRANSVLRTTQGASQPLEDPQAVEALDEKLRVVNGNAESIGEVLEKVARDFVTFGNAFVTMARTDDGQVFCNHEPFQGGRLARRNQLGEITHVGFVEDWKNWTYTQAKKVALYPRWEADENGIERTCIHIANYVPGFDYYGVPDWISSLFFSSLEYMAGRYNQSKIQNGYVPSGILQFFGAVSEEQADLIVKDAKKRLTGLGNNNGLLIQVLSDESLKAVFTPTEQQGRDGEFLELATVAAQEIITAHRWTASLAGVAIAGKLGTNQTVLQEFQMVQNTVIKPIQNKLLAKFVNVFVAEASQNSEVYLQLLNLTPVSFFGTINIETTLTQDEKRAELGFQPLPEEPEQQVPPLPNTNTQTPG
jgi:capsid portal protein